MMDMGKKKKIAAVGACCLVVAIAASVLTGMAPGGGGARGGMPGDMEESNQKTVVDTQSPEIGSIVVTGSYVGTVEPGQQVTVYPKVSGEVTAANFTVGDAVQAGDVLFSVDSTSLQLDLAQQQASLSSAQAKANFSVEVAEKDLETAKYNKEEDYNSQLLSASNSVENAELAVEQAKNSLASAQLSANSARKDLRDLREDRKQTTDYSQTLSYDDVLNQLQQAALQADINVENAQLALENAEQALEQAKASQRAVEKQVEEAEISTEDQVTSARLNADLSDQYIALQKLQNTLSDYTIASPISGIIEQKNLDVFDMATTQTAAYVISNKDMHTISFNITESALEYMRPGDQVIVEKNGEKCIGTISEVSTMVDAASGLYTVKATVENAPFDMRSGSTIKLYADTQKVENELTVPIDAVYYDNGTPYVYVFENNTARKVEIETGITDDTRIHVKSGLSVSDEIIVTWSASLYDGAEVYLPGTAPQAGGEDAAMPELPDGASPDEAGDADGADDADKAADESPREPGLADDEESGDAAQNDIEGETP